MWHHPIVYRIPSLYSYDEETGSPMLEPPDAGIAISAENIDYNGETLSFRLLVTYTFSRDYVRAFARIVWGMVAFIENADTGQCGMFNLSELGRKRYPVVPALNYSGTIEEAGTPTSYKTGWVGLDLELDVPPPVFHPSLFITVKLHQHVSNTIGIDLENGLQRTFREGEPVELEYADLSDEA
jgi:hypothetical protein